MRRSRRLAGLTLSLLAAAPAAAFDGLPEAEPVVEASIPDAARQPADLRDEVERLRARLDGVEAAHATLPRSLHAFPLPERLEFAGEAVPLGRWDVAERLDREFLLSLGNPAQVLLWLKRSARYFPYIERELSRAGLPDDLKYVAVIESALLPGAYSHASALGIWQFIASTARRYGLAVTSGWDERRNPERSTAAALAYLRELRRRFADWPLALAAYNAGEPRIEQAMRHQGVASYYQLALSEESERYVFRALAAKLILSEPERYGFEVPPERRYRPHDADVVVIDLRERASVAELARRAGSFYRELKALNPEIVDDWLGKGRYAIRVPKGHGPLLRAAVGGASRPGGFAR